MQSTPTSAAEVQRPTPTSGSVEFDAMFWGPAQEAAYDEYEDEFIEDCVRQAQQAEEDELDEYLPDDEYLDRGCYWPL